MYNILLNQLRKLTRPAKTDYYCVRYGSYGTFIFYVYKLVLC